MHYTTRLVFSLCLALLAATGCVSKKKHLLMTAEYAVLADSLSFRLDSSTQLIYLLRLDTAERRGENTALLASQSGLLDRIIALDDEIEQLQLKQAFAVEDLDARLQARDAMIAARDARLQAVQQLLEGRNQDLNVLSQSLRDSLAQLDSTVFNIVIKDGQLSLSVLSDFLFAKGSTSRVNSEGETALAYIAEAVSRYPAFEVVVIGHSNNEPLQRSSITDKWTFSAMRAATLVNLMTRRYKLGNNQAMAAGKGEFAPRASNATKEGQQLNERMEFLISPAQSSLLRDLRRRIQD